MKTLSSTSAILLAAGLILAFGAVATVLLNLNLADLFDAGVSAVVLGGVLSLLAWDTAPLDPLRYAHPNRVGPASLPSLAVRCLAHRSAVAATH